MACKNVDLRMRVARAADVTSLQAIERNAVGRYAVLPETRFCLELPVRDEGEHRVARESCALVGDVDGTPVAFALAVPRDGRVHLLEIAVAQAQQGRGCGRRMIAAVEAWAQGSGFREMTLTTFRDVPRNAPFYQGLGYEVIQVGSDRPELASVVAEEQQVGFHQAPRVAIRKSLVNQKQKV